MHEQSREEYSEVSEFSRELNRLFTRTGWRHDQFAAAVARAHGPNAKLESIRKLVPGWLEGTKPDIQYVTPIANALCTHSANAGDAGTSRFEALYATAKRRPRGAGAEISSLPAGPSRDGTEPPPAPPAPVWQPDPPWFLREDFARLNVEPQPAGPADRFTLAVSLRLGSIYLKIEAGDNSPRLAVTVRATQVEILPHENEENVEPVPGTILGRPGNQFPNVTHGVAWQIANPKGQNDPPLDGTRLCDMRPRRGNEPYGVRLTLRCRDIDLDVEVHNPPPDVSEKQFAILRRVLQRMDCHDPDAEHIDLARSGLHRGEMP